MKPRVVMISAPIHPVPPKRGAAVEWWMWQVSRHLRTWEPHIVGIGADGYAAREQVDGVHLRRFRLGRLYKRLFRKITRLDPWGYAARAAAYIERIDADCVHVHNDTALYRELRRRARNPARPYLLHLHNERDRLDGLERAPLIVVSAYLRDWYRARLPEADIRVLTNGVDIAQFADRAVHAADAGFAPTVRRCVLYAGRISPEKGPLHLVRAMREVIAAAPDVGLMIVGEFASGGRDSARVRYGDEVRAALADLPAGHAVDLGVLPPERMHEAFARADLVVMPSEFNEPLGMVALEAMAAGVPVLAAPRGGLTEIIQAGDTGFFLPPGNDPSDYAARIAEVLNLPEATRAAVTARARAYVTAHHDWRVVAAALEDRYAEFFPTP